MAQQQLPLPVPPAPIPVQHVPTRKLIGDGDDEIPSDAELLEMSPKALKSRLDRNTKSQLRERFGVDNFDTIKAQLEELATFKQAQEEKRLAEMTESERYREMYAKADARARELEAQLQNAEESRIIEDQDRRVMAIAASFVKPKHFHYVTQELANYLKGLDEADLSNPEAVIETWFQGWVGENPEFGKDFGSQQAAPPPVAPQAPAPPKQIPLTNGPSLGRPGIVQPPGAQLQKTAAPGRPNSMNESEWREYKRSQGLHW